MAILLLYRPLLFLVWFYQSSEEQEAKMWVCQNIEKNQYWNLPNNKYISCEIESSAAQGAY